jgi:subtilisin family serine protease
MFNLPAATRSLRATALALTTGVACLLAASPALGAGKTSTVSLLPNDALFSEFAWPAKAIDLPHAWALTLGSPKVTIAILDTGVTPVPDLAGALVPGYNFVANDTDTLDDNGHGTEVASIAAARVNNHFGIAGVCGRCSIMPVKVLDANGNGNPETIAEGVNWAAAHGAQIINLSVYSNDDSPVLDAAIAAATAQGVTVVIAAGNSGSSNPAQGGYPAASSPDAITVAGTTAASSLFGWSNRGSSVDVAAPGAASAAMTNRTFFLGLQGTSVASPIVAGIAGLMLSENGTLAPAAVKSLIESTGTPLAGLDVASGRQVDAYRALLGALKA